MHGAPVLRGREDVVRARWLKYCKCRNGNCCACSALQRVSGPVTVPACSRLAPLPGEGLLLLVYWLTFFTPSSILFPHFLFQ